MDSLLAMGFDEQSAEQALTACGGNVDRALDVLLSGGGSFPEEQSQMVGSSGGAGTVVELGVSQYSFGESGTSACTVIACSVIKLLLARLNNAQNNIPNIQELTQAVQNGVTYYRTLPVASRTHLSIDELGSYMTGGVTSVGFAPIQGILTTRGSFQDMFAQARQMSAPGKYIAIVVTKPPETVCVLLPPAGAQPGAKYIFFDSHSRPQYGYAGAYLVLCDDEMGLVNRLQAVFPPLQMDGEGDNYMSMMYNMFEGSVFQSS